MTNYWSCSKFANWIRGTKKLGFGTAEQWEQWEVDAKHKYPVRWWLAEEGLDYVQAIVGFVPKQIYSAKYYINNRWVTKTHSLSAHSRDIKPGAWRDVGDRFLPCMFNELVDFVEIELAWWHIAWSDKEVKLKYKAPFWASGWWRWRTWRCSQAGLDNLAWQSSLRYSEDEGFDPGDPHIGKLTPQAVKAKEILDLYTWWTQIRPARPDAYEASGWSAACEAQRIANGGKMSWSGSKDPVIKKAQTKARKLLEKIEADYEAEDEAMMIRLIKVRHGLWT